MDDRKNKTGNKLPPGSTATLLELFAGIDFKEVHSGQESCAQRLVGKVSSDSREIDQDDLFIALPGTRTDGHRFVAAVTAKNCAAVVVEEGSEWNVADGWQGIVVEVPDCRYAYAQIAENYYGRPAEKVKLIGITGTNGKTTTTYLLEDVLKGLGCSVGVIGTINYRYLVDDKQVVLPSPFTTPEAMQLQALLFEMTEAGVEYVIMEVSSHALEQQRIGNLRFNIAGFTNLSRDHLDYHSTMEEYFAAKTLLFSNHLDPAGCAIISTPQQPGEVEDWSGNMVDYCCQHGIRLRTCGKDARADVRIESYQSTLKKTEINLILDGQQLRVTTPLVGHFNVDNYVTALGLALALSHRAELLVLDRIFGEVKVPEVMIGSNIVHLPTVKTHMYTVTTGAMKNAFGGLLHRNRHWTHAVIHDTLVDLLTIQQDIHPGIFAVMDGTFAGDGPGPRAMRWHEKNILLASSDQVAIDAVSAKLQGFDPLSLRFIRKAHEMDLGVGDPRQIEIVGYDIENEAPWNFKQEDTLASRGQHMIYHGRLKPFEKFLLQSPLVPWSYFASNFYHNVYWYPFVGRKRVSTALQTEWGKLFESYGDGTVVMPGMEPKTVVQAAAGLTMVAVAALGAAYVLRRK